MCLSPHAEYALRLGRGNPAPGRGEVPDAIERRLLKAVAGLAAGTAGLPDVVGLVGHVLRRCQAAGRTCHVHLGLHGDTGHAAWREAGLACEELAGGGVRVGLDPAAAGLAWHPDVLRAAEAAPCRSFSEVPGDPWMLHLAPRPGCDASQWPTYRSEGQAQAIRGLTTLPPGGVGLVLLPTGGGKSTCIHHAVATARSPADLVVVVVPTVALALDQERECRKVLPALAHPTAYVGGADAATREAIRARVREGTQRVLFTSPESLMGSLFHALLAAARAGRLAWLVIDEAHIVEAWGEGFRPEFRLLAGFRRAILRATPGHVPAPRTALLTATASARVADALRTQMFDPGAGRPLPPWRVLGALALRTEHHYVVQGFASTQAKEEAAWRALHVLPRPLYLYATKRDDVEDWHGRLREHGFRRVAKVHGGSSAGERRDVLQQLEDERVDIVVANSAFGLGVNQPDVRSVLHVAVPEDLDRYYQEAGRAGRDGNAAVAVLLHAPADVRLAREMSEPKSIGEERGLRRLEDMWAHKEATPDEHIWRFRLNTRAIGNVRHEEWDRLTVVLLAEAGVLSLEAMPRDLPAKAGDSTTDGTEEGLSWDSDVCVTLWEPRILEGEAGWRRLVEPTRERRLREAREAFGDVEAFLRDPGSLWKGLCRIYAIELEGRSVAPPAVPGASEMLRVPAAGPEAQPGGWEPLGMARGWFVAWPRIAFEQGAWHGLARRALQQGFRWFVGDLDLLRDWARSLPTHERDRVILSAQPVVLRAPPMPWVAVVSGRDAVRWEPLARAARVQAAIVLLPADTGNAEHGSRSLADDLGRAWLAPDDAERRLGP